MSCRSLSFVSLLILSNALKDHTLIETIGGFLKQTNTVVHLVCSVWTNKSFTASLLGKLEFPYFLLF